MAVLRVYRVYKHQIQLSTYLRLIDNFNQGLRFVDLVVYFDKTKTVLGLRFVDSRSLSLIAFSVMQEMLADNRFSKISREKSTLS